METTFANFIRKLRIEAGYSLREFCRAINADASNWSKIERGLLKPPQTKKALEEIAAVVKLEPDTEPYKHLFDLAAIATISDELVEGEIIDQLPIFFRTVRSEKPSETDLNKLVTKIKSAWEPKK